MTVPTHTGIQWTAQDEDNGEPFPGIGQQLDYRLNAANGVPTIESTESSFAAASVPTFDATPTHHAPVDPWGGWTAQATTASPTTVAEPQIAGLTAL